MGLFLAKLNSKNPNIAAFYFCKTQDFYFRSLRFLNQREWRQEAAKKVPQQNAVS
jgi:hypothetical protein